MLRRLIRLTEQNDAYEYEQVVDPYDTYVKDPYGRPINRDLLYDDVEELTYKDESFAYSKDLYEDELVDEFMRHIKNSKMTASVKSTLMTYYKRQSSKDIVLGNYEKWQAKVDVETLRLDLMIERLNLRREDKLQVYNGSWDTQVRLIIGITKAKYNRQIDGFERRMQVTTKTVQQIDDSQYRYPEPKKGLFK